MAVVELSDELAYRVDFSLLCNRRGLTRAVEVGVAQAVFAAQFMERWDGDLLFLVDDYAGHAEYPGRRDGDLVTACLALLPFHGRYRFVGLDSLAAAAWLPAWVSPGFVYIDAAHDYDSVRADLLAWWPHVTADGILAGHDYDETHPGVVRAVREFAEERGLVVRLTRDELSSWYVYKTEPENLVHVFFNDSSSANPHYRREG